MNMHKDTRKRACLHTHTGTYIAPRNEVFAVNVPMTDVTETIEFHSTFVQTAVLVIEATSTKTLSSSLAGKREPACQSRDAFVA